GAKIGRITTAGVVTEFGGLPAGAKPGGITSGPDGAIWWTDIANNTINRMTTAGAPVDAFTVPTANSEPANIVSGGDGRLWFTEFQGNKIGAVTTAGVFTEYTGLAVGAGPFGLTADAAGIWFTERAGDGIGFMTLTGGLTEHPLTLSGAK